MRTLRVFTVVAVSLFMLAGCIVFWPLGCRGARDCKPHVISLVSVEKSAAAEQAYARAAPRTGFSLP